MNEQTTINGNMLIDWGWPEGPAIGAALDAVGRLQTAEHDQSAVLHQLARVQANPADFLHDEIWGAAARHLNRHYHPPQPQKRDKPVPLSVWGRELIDEGSFEQINNAARLPVALRVALMPDAHIGYGLPIGGVAALQEAIAPYMVGVDIGCRLHATIFDRNPIHLRQDTRGYVKHLYDHTYFGRQSPPRNQRNQHPILDDGRWAELPHHLRHLKDIAAEQLGTSGGGNHFAEFAQLRVAADNPLGIQAGKYVVLVSHSGSRGVGYQIAQHYSQLAKEMCPHLPDELRDLAYFETGTAEATEYETAMNLAGEFARANHEVIHERVQNAIGRDLVVGTLQNHHNFAWRVTDENGRAVFIHRKGATPAGKGQLGIIPGSMATPGFFVEGQTDTDDNILNHPALNSAAHGSGRVLGRRHAKRKLRAKPIRDRLKKQGVTLIGGGLDEAPDVYKDSREVIAAQADLVRVWAEFDPLIVRMESPRGKSLGQ